MASHRIASHRMGIMPCYVCMCFIALKSTRQSAFYPARGPFRNISIAPSPRLASTRFHPHLRCSLLLSLSLHCITRYMYMYTMQKYVLHWLCCNDAHTCTPRGHAPRTKRLMRRTREASANSGGARNSRHS